jgi:transcriptional regulator with XRE-family HTH domain
MIHPLQQFRDRHEPPLSRRDLAKLLGVSPASVTRWENGKRLPEKKLLPLISEQTGISPEQLRPDIAELMRAPEPPDSEPNPRPAQA